MRSLEITTAASVLPVSVADAQTHLRINDTAAESALFTDWIKAAATLFERTTGYTLTSTVYRYNLDAFPDGPFLLPRWPVTAVASTQYLDTSGNWQTLSGTSTDLASAPARVILPDDLPSLHATKLPAVRVNFTAGHAQAADVPKLITNAVKLMVGHWYATGREAYRDSAFELRTTPAGWEAVTQMYRGGWIGGDE